MTDLYLKTLTQEDMDAALLEAGVIDDEGSMYAKGGKARSDTKKDK